MRKKKAGKDSESFKPTTGEKWLDPDDAPRVTDDMLDRAEIHVDGKLVQLASKTFK